MNGCRVKSSAAVEAGATISLVKPDGGNIVLRVLKVPPNTNVSRKERTSLYEILERGEPDCS